jgi:5-methylcytosine-specific restriction endonuclease McrA
VIEVKLCRPGGHHPPATEGFFYRNRNTGRLRSHCKDCRRRDASGWYDRNIERAQEGQRAYREQNRKMIIAKVKAAKAADPEAERQRCASKEARRRAQKKVGVTEYVDRLVVFERDGGICGICAEPVEREDFHLDHVIPLSKGGAHSYENVQVAHPPCNLAKSNKVDFALSGIAGGDHFAI